MIKQQIYLLYRVSNQRCYNFQNCIQKMSNTQKPGIMDSETRKKGQSNKKVNPYLQQLRGLYQQAFNNPSINPKQSKNAEIQKSIQTSSTNTTTNRINRIALRQEEQKGEKNIEFFYIVKEPIFHPNKKKTQKARRKIEKIKRIQKPEKKAQGKVHKPNRYKFNYLEEKHTEYESPQTKINLNFPSEVPSFPLLPGKKKKLEKEKLNLTIQEIIEQIGDWKPITAEQITILSIQKEIDEYFLFKDKFREECKRQGKSFEDLKYYLVDVKGFASFNEYRLEQLIKTNPFLYKKTLIEGKFYVKPLQVLTTDTIYKRYNETMLRMKNIINQEQNSSIRTFI